MSTSDHAGGSQLLYVALTSSFPFNSLLSGLAGSAGFAVLTREQTLFFRTQ